MSICLLTEVKLQWAMLKLGWVTVSVRDQLWDVSKLEFLKIWCTTHVSDGFALALGDQNTFWPCFLLPTNSHGNNTSLMKVIIVPNESLIRTSLYTC